MGKKRGSDHLDLNTTDLTLDKMIIDSSSSSPPASYFPSTVASPSSSSTTTEDRSIKRRATPMSGDTSDDLLVSQAPDGVVEIGGPGDIEMQPFISGSVLNSTLPSTLPSFPPPNLPPRPTRKNTLEQEVSSYMAFGKFFFFFFILSTGVMSNIWNVVPSYL